VSLEQLVPPSGHCYNPYRWLYTLFLGIDANFHLKRKNVSNDAADPDLNEGCAYFVEEKEYKKYLSEYKAEKEPVRPIPIKQLTNPSLISPSR
jgi:hypothetical protein